MINDISKYSNTPIKHMPEDYCPTHEMYFFENQKGLNKGKRMFYSDSIKSWGHEGLNIEVRAILGRWDPLAQNEVIKQWIKKLPHLKNNIKI
ncbi:MAG: hypothetical protein ACQERB_05655 [Promethearchaeati archaeon]